MSDFNYDLSDLGDPFSTEPPKANEISVENEDGTTTVIEDTSSAYPIAIKLSDARKRLKELEAANAEQRVRQENLKKQREELQKQLDGISTEINNIELELYDYRRTRREIMNEISALTTALNQAIFNEARQKELIENKIEFDKKMHQFAYADKIMPHQRDGAFILATNMKVILGDKMGAGKTLTSIAAWDMAQCQRILVVVPDDVVSNFVREINYWAPHRNVIQLGKMSKAERQFALSMAQAMESFVLVVNYSAWRKDKSLITSLIELRLDTVVMDEAHEIKNTSTSAYRGVKEIVLAANCCPLCSGPVTKRATEDGWNNYLDCDFCEWDSQTNSDWKFYDRCSVKMVVPMTGTVILNRPQDLFALLSLVDPINFREQNDFLSAYCTQDLYTMKWKFRSGGLASLQKKLSGHYLAREGVKTPGQKIYNHDIVLDPALYPAQHKVIDQLSKHAQIILDSGKKLPILYTISLITRKRQANVWPAGIQLKDEVGNVVFRVSDEVTESAKLDKCIMPTPDGWDGLINDLTEGGDKEAGSRVVVFSQFKGPLEELERRLNAAGIDTVRFDGDTPQKIRDEAKIDFDRKYTPGKDYKWQVILCNYRTGGVGLNFTAATETIILDREWNPGKEGQALARTDRIGQTEESNVHVLRIVNTIDSWMDALIEEKSDLINGFNNHTKDLGQELLDAMRSGDVM